MLPIEIKFTGITAEANSVTCYGTNGRRITTVSTATATTPRWSLRYSMMFSMTLLNTGFESTRNIYWEYLNNRH